MEALIAVIVLVSSTAITAMAAYFRALTRQHFVILNNYQFLMMNFQVMGVVIPSQGNNPAAPLTPDSTVMPSTSCKHGKE